jgi:hypothetical protein
MSVSPNRSGRRPLGDIHNIIRSPTSKSVKNILDANNDGRGFDVFTDSLVSPKKRRLVSSVQRSEFTGGASTFQESEKNSREMVSRRIFNAVSLADASSPQRQNESITSGLLADGSQSLKSNTKKRKDHRAKNTSSPDAVNCSMGNINSVPDGNTSRGLLLISALDTVAEAGITVMVKCPGRARTAVTSEEGSLISLSEVTCKSEKESTIRDITLSPRGSDTQADGYSFKALHDDVISDCPTYSVGDDAHFQAPSTDQFSLQSSRMDSRSIIESRHNISPPHSAILGGYNNATIEQRGCRMGIAFMPQQMNTPINGDSEDYSAAATAYSPIEATILTKPLKRVSLPLVRDNIEGASAITDVSYASILDDIDRMKLQGVASKISRIRPPSLPLRSHLVQLNEKVSNVGTCSPTSPDRHSRTALNIPIQGAAETISVAHDGLSEAGDEVTAEVTSAPVVGSRSDPVQAAPSQSAPSVSPHNTPEDMSDEDREFALFHSAVAAARESSLAVLFKGTRGPAGQGLTPVQQQGVAFYKSELSFMSSSAVIKRGELLAPLGSHRLDTTVLSTARKDRIESSSPDLSDCMSNLSMSNVQLTTIEKNDRLPQLQCLSARVPLSDLVAYQDMLHTWRSKYKKVSAVDVPRSHACSIVAAKSSTADQVVQQHSKPSPFPSPPPTPPSAVMMISVQEHGGEEKNDGASAVSVWSDGTPHSKGVLCV